MLPEEETLLLKAAKAARKAYLPEMDNWDSLKPSAVKAWVDVAKAVRDSVDESYSRAAGTQVVVDAAARKMVELQNGFMNGADFLFPARSYDSMDASEVVEDFDSDWGESDD